MLCARHWTRTSTRTCRTPWARLRRSARCARRAGGSRRASCWAFRSAATRCNSPPPSAGSSPPGITAPLAVDLESDIRPHAVQRNLTPLGEIRNIVAVASGKGGVGKSTVAVNLALAWAAQGARVGVLDADIYGPRQPLMLGLAGQRPLTSDGKRLRPLLSHRASAMSNR